MGSRVLRRVLDDLGATLLELGRRDAVGLVVRAPLAASPDLVAASTESGCRCSP